MPVSRAHRCIFVHIPKTAGRSIEKALGIYGPDNNGSNQLARDMLWGFDGQRYLQHLTLAEIAAAVDPGTFSSYFKFAVVRNPFDRMVSEFFWRQTADPHWKSLSFQEFVADAVAESGHVRSDRHDLSQCTFVAPADRGELDLIARFEWLPDEMARIWRRLGARAPLPHLGRSPRGDYRSYYNAVTRRAVEALYGEELERFGYAF